MLKFAAIGVFAGIIADVIGDTGAMIAGAVAIVTGMGALWRSVVIPFARLVRRALNSYEALENIAEALQKIGDVAARLSVIEGRLDRLEARTESVHDQATAAREPAEAIARELGVQHRHP